MRPIYGWLAHRVSKEGGFPTVATAFRYLGAKAIGMGTKRKTVITRLFVVG